MKVSFHLAVTTAFKLSTHNCAGRNVSELEKKGRREKNKNHMIEKEDVEDRRKGSSEEDD
jgi:hypothetical protein